MASQYYFYLYVYYIKPKFLSLSLLDNIENNDKTMMMK